MHAILDKERLISVLDRVSTILDTESKLVRIDPCSIYVVGDTHGDFKITAHALLHLFPPNGSHHTNFDKVIFLGDFIDRGVFSVENINFLMSMKAMYPDRVVLIRGNHETREINSRFDFYERILRRYDPRVFEKYNQIFAKLPLAILTWNNIFAVHGGIPEGLEHLNDLNGLEGEVDPENRITFQLLWNDPVEKDGWFYNNFRGKYSRRFGREAALHFMEKHHVKLIVRAHEPQKFGFKEYFKKFGDQHEGLISLDSSHKGKSHIDRIKVFVMNANGEFRVAPIEEFQPLNFSKIFG
jgi:diadenosine tetraphosphatase ApaH/serine/threonine PP2A family protein phosphatase